MSNQYAIVLAAGKGTRMKSQLPKVLHPVCGKPMLKHILDKLIRLSVDEIVVVIGHRAEMVRNQIGNAFRYALQEQQLGTAHAVMICREQLADKTGTTLVLNGDTPLVKEDTIKKLREHHRETRAAATVLTMVLDDPTGYGRVIRDVTEFVERIVEHKDAAPEEKAIREVSTGIFCFDNQLLFAGLDHVKNDNAQGEYYLPDLIQILKAQKQRISAYRTNDPQEGMGINDPVQLAAVESILRKKGV